MVPERGDVVRGPDFFGSSPARPYVCVHDESHPFASEEGVFVAVTTTQRSVAIPLTDADFVTGGLPRTSYVNPWTVTTIKHVDVQGHEGVLVSETVDVIADALCSIVGHEC